MKFSLVFKTPNVLGQLDNEEQLVFVKRWVKYNDSVELTFDDEAETVIVNTVKPEDRQTSFKFPPTGPVELSDETIQQCMADGLKFRKKIERQADRMKNYIDPVERELQDTQSDFGLVSQQLDMANEKLKAQEKIILSANKMIELLKKEAAHYENWTRVYREEEAEKKTYDDDRITPYDNRYAR